MQYRNAPIQEAVFDINVTGVQRPDIRLFEEIGRTNFLDFPRIEKRIANSVEINQKSQEIKSESGVKGLIFTNNTGRKKIQIRKDGFAFNMLKPYSDWADFSREAFTYWKVYEQNIIPIGIRRIALRYVNSIVVPVIGKINFDEYFTIIPKVPQVLPQILNGYFSQIQCPCDDEGKIYATITQTFRRPKAEEIHFILDIDVAKIILKDPDLNLFEDFEKMRHYKNSLFESIITDKTRELFK